jgi:cysteinyl-tRNA synthetase
LLAPYGGGLACDDPARNVFDIHGGGIDLVFPHHENEIAQSCCAFGTPTMANVWMHNGFLQVESEKMSKSLGNFITIRDLLESDSFGGRAWHGDVLRLAMLRSHYRQPIDWTVQALNEAQQTLMRWYENAPAGGSIDDGVIEALSDDLNTPAVIARLHQVEDAANRAATLAFLGFSNNLDAVRNYKFLHPINVSDVQTLGRIESDATGSRSLLSELTARIDSLVSARSDARLGKNWAESDRLRDEIDKLGVDLKDNKDGSTKWEFKP